MTLESVIEHCKEVAIEEEKLYKRYDAASGYLRSHDESIRTSDAKECEKRAAEYRQIAEWLKELNRLRAIVPFINKPCISSGVCEHDKMQVLDKVRAEIEELDGKYVIGDYAIYGENIPKYVRLWDVLRIIDECKAESEE